MFDYLRKALAKQRETQRQRAEPGRRLSDAELADRRIPKEAPRWRVLTRSDGEVTLFWEIASGWYVHAWGSRGEVEISDSEREATAHADQIMNLMTGDIKKDTHPDWTDADWEQAHVDENHREFDELAAAGFDITQESVWQR